MTCNRVHKVLIFESRISLTQRRLAAVLAHNNQPTIEKTRQKTLIQTPTTFATRVCVFFWNQSDTRNVPARPKAGISFGISKTGATGKFGIFMFIEEFTDAAISNEISRLHGFCAGFAQSRKCKFAQMARRGERKIPCETG